MRLSPLLWHLATVLWFLLSALAAPYPIPGTRYTRKNLPDNRKPALYTQTYGDCYRSSTINVTRFNGAFYRDNMTVMFDLGGSTLVDGFAMSMQVELNRPWLTE